MPLLLIHGFPLDRTLWRTQIAGLSQLYRVIAPDLRGFGQSSETDGEAVTMDQYAADLKSLLDSVNVQEAVIGGISMGGYIALAFYAQYADRVALLSNSTVAAIGTPEEVLTEENLSPAYGLRIAVYEHPGHGAPLVHAENWLDTDASDLP